MSILEQKRREAKLSRRELADLTGISIRTIEGYEQGLKKTDRMELRTALKLADFLGFDVRLFIS